MTANRDKASQGSYSFYRLNEEFSSNADFALQVQQGISPLVSIIMPAFNTPPNVLRKAVNSVLDQTYKCWELLIIDDHSDNVDTVNTIKSISSDKRIKTERLKINSGISDATNYGIKLARGEYIAFMDHDDALLPASIYECIEKIVTQKLDIVYTDQASIDEDDNVIHEFRKPAWSPEYFRHVMYVGHLLVAKKDIIINAGMLNRKYNGVQDHELMLRMSELTSAIGHIPKVLYHWRAIEGSIAKSEDAKDNITELQVQAVQEHLVRSKINGTVAPHHRYKHRCKIRPARSSGIKVSIIIPTKDQPELIKACLESIRQTCPQQYAEIVCVDTGTTDAEALYWMNQYSDYIVPFARDRFNFSAACNAGAERSSGEILIFLNNDTKIITNDFFLEVLRYFEYSDVGIVGPLLLYPDHSVQHAGVVLGARGTADHVMRGFPSTSDGYAGSLSCPREVSAVTGACLAIRKDLFYDCAGFSEAYFTHYQDVDLCLKASAKGARIIFTPHAILFHYESKSRGGYYDYLDRLLFMDTWRNKLKAGDQFYGRGLCLQKLDYSKVSS